MDRSPDAVELELGRLPYNGTEYDAAVKRFYEHVEGNGRWPAQPYHSNSNAECQYDDNECHAMFMYGTHGAVRFAQDIADLILEENKYKWYRHVNTTNQIKVGDVGGPPKSCGGRVRLRVCGSRALQYIRGRKAGRCGACNGVGRPVQLGPFAAPDGGGAGYNSDGPVCCGEDPA